MRLREFASQIPESQQLVESFSWDDPVIPALGDIYTFKDLALDMGFALADIAAGLGGAIPSGGASLAIAGTALTVKVAERANVIRKVWGFIKGIVPNPAAIARGLGKMSPANIAKLHVDQWATMGKQAIMQVLMTLGINTGWKALTGGSSKDDDEFTQPTGF
jgi:hypothetical protein